MKWLDFEQKVREKGIVIFTPLDVQRFLGTSKIATRFLVHRHKAKGYIVRLKRGLYKLSDQRIPDFYLANKLYEPSYVSLEFALSYHRIIPETVYTITSVTTKKTQRFVSLGKVFNYRHIKRSAFTGYSVGRTGKFSFLIAEPEKAFVDLNYLRMILRKKPISRFDKGKLKLTKALRYAKLFANPKLISIITTTLK